MSEHNPRDIINPVEIDTVIPGSVTALTAEELPGRIFIKVQILMPPQTNPQTLMIDIDQNDARQLHKALGACLKGTTQ